jgi:hypothetical protein
MGGKPNTMNSSRLIPALAGGLLGLYSFAHLDGNRAAAAIQRPSVVPAVVRIFDATPARLATSPHGWSSTESLLERNPDDFRKLTGQEIESCALALEGMSRRVNLGSLGSRSYLQTRIQALREHVDYARDELVKLPSSQGDENFIPAHAHFYRTMKSLEQAFAQAATELNGDI